MAMGSRIILFIVMFHIALYLSGYGWGLGTLESFVEINETTDSLRVNESTTGILAPQTQDTSLVGGLITIISSAITMAITGVQFLFGLTTAPLALFFATGVPFVIKLIISVPLAILYMLAIFAFWKGTEI